jgi:putative heme transporter
MGMGLCVSSAINPALSRSASYAWRLIVVATAIAIMAWGLARIAIIIGAMFVALLITRILMPIARALRRARFSDGAAAAASMGLFLILLCGTISAASFTVVGQIDSLSESLDSGARDIERWIVSTSVIDVSNADLERYRQSAANSLAKVGSSGGSSVLVGVITVGKLIVGLFLALIVSFFFLKDGERFRDGVVNMFPTQHQSLAAEAANRAWGALGGYLRGSALLGTVEAAIVGTTLAVTGSSLIAPVMVLTFIGAFVPVVGAIATGVIAILVALATSGLTAALIMAGVALAVQQLDNDLLAPVLYGKALRLHPLFVLLGVAAGGSAFGITGSVCAVPVIAMLSGVRDAFENRE